MSESDSTEIKIIHAQQLKTISEDVAEIKKDMKESLKSIDSKMGGIFERIDENNKLHTQAVQDVEKKVIKNETEIKNHEKSIESNTRSKIGLYILTISSLLAALGFLAVELIKSIGK